MGNRSALCFCGLVAVVFLITISYNSSDAQDKKRSGIRSIDFLNFTYDPSLCSQEYWADGDGRNVRLKKGEFKAQKSSDENVYAYLGIVNNKIFYGDLTNDGNEAAVVHIACGLSRANFGLNDIFIYALRNLIHFLLARITDNKIERDYKRYCRSSMDRIWTSVNGINVGKQCFYHSLSINDPPHCAEQLNKARESRFVFAHPQNGMRSQDHIMKGVSNADLPELL